MKYVLNSENETQELVEKFTKEISLPLIVGLQGDLGVGKTVFVRSIIKSYNKNERVKSPTFSLVEEYQYDKIDITHIDLYRIRKNEKYYLNISDYQNEKSLILIEWINNDKKLMNYSDIIINIAILDSKETRIIEFSANSKNGKKIIQNIENEFKK